jgi:hypothetical protein
MQKKKDPELKKIINNLKKIDENVVNTAVLEYLRRAQKTWGQAYTK